MGQGLRLDVLEFITSLQGFTVQLQHHRCNHLWVYTDAIMPQS